jgi:threonine dehydrogenase-like Zn-dependent dehydrogenase
MWLGALQVTADFDEIQGICLPVHTSCVRASLLLGTSELDIYYSDYRFEVAPESVKMAAPRALEEVAVLVEPLSIAAKAADVFATIHSRFGFDAPRPQGLVQGAGPLGLLAAMVLQAHGIENYVYSRAAESDPCAVVVRSFGTDYISAGGAPQERLSERTGSIDIILEAAGAPQAAFGVLPANGVLILSGVPAVEDPVPVDLSRWMCNFVLKNRVLWGTVNAGLSACEEAIHRLEQFMALFPSAVGSLICWVPFDQAPTVLARGRGIKDAVWMAA